MKKFWFVFIFVFSVFSFVSAADIDDEEDLIEDEDQIEENRTRGKNKTRTVSKNDRERQKQRQVKQWLNALNGMKKGRGNESQIVSLISKILNYDPGNLKALNTLGVFYMENGKIHLAKIIFTRILKKYPKNSAVHNNLGIIALKEGKKEEAISAFLKSLDSRYNNYVASANLGALYLEAYEYKLALKYLEAAYRMSRRYLSPNHREMIRIANNYAVALAWNGRAGRADSILEGMIEKNPNETSLLLNYAILLGRNLNEKEKSFRFLRRVDLMDKSRYYGKQIQALRNYLNEQRKG